VLPPACHRAPPGPASVHSAVRVIGLDLGSRRIGVAVSDATATLASPLTVVRRSGVISADHQRLAVIIASEGAERVVVGLPLSLDGTAGPAAKAATAEVAALSVVVEVPVEMFDERLTTVSAHRSLKEQGLRTPARRRVVDQMAAAVMLQSWLDGPGRRQPMVPGAGAGA
jgi:putative Holliday junction resolvase